MSENIRLVEKLKKQLSDVEKEHANIISERDEALEDLRNVENAFNDVHR
jgi:hypothetical protein